MPLRTLCGSREEVRISTLTGVWKKLILSLASDLEEFKLFSGGRGCRCGGNSKAAKCKVEPEELQPHDETNGELLLMEK